MFKISFRNLIFLIKFFLEVNHEYVEKHDLFSILDEVNVWRKTRNDLMHDLAEDDCSIDDVRRFAVEGNILVSKLNNKSSLINDHNDKL